MESNLFIISIKSLPKITYHKSFLDSLTTVFLFCLIGGGKLARLTTKQKEFADEYILSGNAMQSAIKVGYSVNYAKSQSHKLLENVGIKSYIDKKTCQNLSNKTYNCWHKNLYMLLKTSENRRLIYI